MLSFIKDYLSDFFKSRFLILGIVFALLAALLLNRLFQLQIVNGQDYRDSFNVTIKKESVIPCTRGLIYDCNGELLAYNELVYSVVIEDNGDYSDLEEKNKTLNPALLRLFAIIESHGDSVVSDFSIVLNQSNEYEFTVSGKQRRNFLANVYGVSVKKLKKEQENATAAQVMEYLCNKSHYDLKESENLSKSDILKIVTIRFGMTQNNYQKYIPTTVASDVSSETVAIVLENADNIPGISIQEDSVRRYHEDSQYASHILGYTGNISEDELQELKYIDEKYTENYVVGKTGIEASMESALQGIHGSETFYVDNLGKVIQVEDRVDPVAGNDVYLTIDIKLQKVIYKILEQHVAGLLSSKIVNESAYVTRKIEKSDDVVISIDDVYFALINNNVIDMEILSRDGASPVEQQVLAVFQNKLQAVKQQITEQMQSPQAAAKNDLPESMQSYMEYMEQRLVEDGYISGDVVTSDDTYQMWKDGKISLRDYLFYCIGQNWIDVTKISSQSAYADADEIYHFMLQYLLETFDTDAEFHKKVYEYMILDHELSGEQICRILGEQGAVQKDESYSSLTDGRLSAISYIIGKINSLQITPAQLALDPCSASAIVTDVNTGQVKALVTYPSYDNKRLANRIESKYYSQLLNDKSLPLFNRATQQKTAPGSTFKMLSSIAGLEEGVITPQELIQDEGRFLKVSNTPKCWYYPRSHGNLNVSQALEHSCNYFFYEVGYRLSTDENGEYDEDLGIQKLTKYAQMFGFGEKSGVEIEESVPSISQKYPVMAAIGQAEHNFSTTQLAKYVTAVANSGTVYDLTLVDKIMNAKGDLLEKFEPKVYCQTSFARSTWDAVHSGMRDMALSTSTLRSLQVEVAGKTGTAQQDTTRPNHAQFVGYAPYGDPQISIAVKEAYGYTSGNATAIARDILSYYFGERTEEQIVTGSAVFPGSEVIHD